jgi:hypothetical protein
VLGDLARTQSKAYYRFDENIGGEVLAAFDDGTPALIVRQVGTGRVVWFNASADDRWCDLPRCKSFVPLVDRLLTYLSTSGWRRSFLCGETVVLRLPDAGAEQAVVESPSHTPLDARIETTAGGTFLRLDGPMEAGFYEVLPTSAGTGDKPPLWFVVQPSRDESALAPVDPDTLRAWWSPATMELVKPSSFASAIAASDGRLALEPWLLLLAGLVFLAETFLVHWLCPRINPALAAAPARRRGFVAPLRGREGAAP